MASISKRTSGAWQNTSYDIRATATDTITTLPTTIYGDGTPLLDYLISGNTTQSGTPTPESPIMPQGTGDLETSGAKAGQYKIPISSASTTTPIYLGEVQSTRKIKKLVLTGNEPWGTGGNRVYITNFGVANQSSLICTHFTNEQNTGMWNGNNWVFQVDISQHGITTKSEWVTYLQSQYAAGTPVTVWYVLAAEETAVVNEPLMSIGDYADTLSKAQAGVTIPTSNGSTTVDVETTVKPSEVSINYHGWHMGTVHERVSGQWD